MLRCSRSSSVLTNIILILSGVNVSSPDGLNEGNTTQSVFGVLFEVAPDLVFGFGGEEEATIESAWRNR